MVVRRRAAGRVVRRHGVVVLLWVLFGLWFACSAAFTVRVGVEGVFRSDDTLWCSTDGGSSFYGTASWSWSQLGTVCNGELPQAGSFETGPGLIRWFALVVLAGWGATLVLAGRALRRPSGDPPPVEVGSLTAT